MGLVWTQHGEPRAAFAFTIADGKILEIELVSDPDRLCELDPVILGD